MLPPELAAAFAAKNNLLTLGEYVAASNTVYYAQGTAFGRTGDFITAPDVSQLFGEMIGIWCVQQWEALGKPVQWQLIELGSGRGTLLADALRVMLKFIPRDSFQIYAFEFSEALRTQQRAAWQSFDLPMHWPDDWQQIPAAPCITIANEFLDALPIEQYQWDGSQWRQHMIRCASSGSELVWHTEPAAVDLPALPQTGAIYECPTMRHAAIAPLAAKLQRDGGSALFVDYGHAEAAHGDTLQAVKAHQRVDVLAYPGTADLTAHVNFHALQQWAQTQGLQTSAITTQGDFLHAMGIEARLKQLQAHADPGANLQLLSAYQRLTAPSQMGTLFKALSLHAPLATTGTT